MPSGPNTKCNQEAEWVDGLVTEKCPVVWVPEYTMLFRIYNASRDRAILPYSGGFMDQPAALMSAMDIISAEERNATKQ